MTMLSICLLVLSVAMASGTKTCSIDRNGYLVTFLGKRFRFQQPCAYSFMEMQQIGKARIKFKYQLDVEQINRVGAFITMVSVTDTETNKKLVAYMDEEFINGWQVDRDQTDRYMSRMITRDPATNTWSIAKPGYFSVTDNGRVLTVTIENKEMSSNTEGYQFTVCGAREGAFGWKNNADYTHMTNMAYYFATDELLVNHEKELETCKSGSRTSGIRRIIRYCPDHKQEEAMGACRPLQTGGVRDCLANSPLMEYAGVLAPYQFCIQDICDGYPTDMQFYYGDCNVKSGQCPEGGYYGNWQKVNGRCLMVIEERATRAEAINMCRYHYGRLMDIKTHRDLAKLRKLLDDTTINRGWQNVWLGDYTDPHRESALWHPGKYDKNAACWQGMNLVKGKGNANMKLASMNNCEGTSGGNYPVCQFDHPNPM